MAKKIKKRINKKAKRILECFVCHRTFNSTVGNLRRHVKLHVPIVDNFQCWRCLKCFQTKGNYNLHWKIHHLDISPTAEKPLKIPTRAKRK